MRPHGFATRAAGFLIVDPSELFAQALFGQGSNLVCHSDGIPAKTGHSLRYQRLIGVNTAAQFAAGEGYSSYHGQDDICGFAGHDEDLAPSSLFRANGRVEVDRKHGPLGQPRAQRRSRQSIRQTLRSRCFFNQEYPSALK